MQKYQTLCEFLAAHGGLRLFRSQQDTCGAGELRAMNAELWHRAAPFRKKLVRLESGMCPDDAALAATEAGYFPELGRRAEIGELLEAIDNELRGDPVYTGDDRAKLEIKKREAAMGEYAGVIVPPGRVYPPDAELIRCQNGDEVALYEKIYRTKKRRVGTIFYAKAFLGLDTTHAWHRGFHTAESRQESVNRFLGG